MNGNRSLRVLVAHNLYRSAAPSGENAVVAAQMEQLRVAGVDVIPFLRSSDAIAGSRLTEKVAAAAGPVYHPHGVRDFRTALIRHRPDIVHVHNVYPLLSPWVVREARAADVPVVQTVHNFRHDCVSGLFFRDGRTCTDCSGTVTAHPALRHGCYRGSRFQTVPMVIGRAVHRSTWLDVDRFVVLTPFHTRYLRSLGVDETRIVVSPTTVEDPGPATAPGRDLLFAGRWSAEKGLDLLLEAWTVAAPTGRRLRIAGDGPLAPHVRERAAADPSIEALGPLPPEGIAAQMRSCAAVVIPSQCFEGFPKVAAEAMAHGRATIVNDVGGLAYVVDEQVGWRALPESAAWAATLAGLADGEVARRGRQARARFEENLTAQAGLQSLLAVYASVAREKSPSWPT